jgi:hypothetical protein
MQLKMKLSTRLILAIVCFVTIILSNGFVATNKSLTIFKEKLNEVNLSHKKLVLCTVMQKSVLIASRSLQDIVMGIDSETNKKALTDAYTDYDNALAEVSKTF